jgi:hypothetical protein
MTTKKSVLVIGLEPTLVDFSTLPNMDAAKVRAGLEAEQARLAELGYETQLCLIDLGETAEGVVMDELGRKDFDCIVVGAGVRTIPRYFLLFEKLINLLHEHAPRAKLCFNTNPSDTVEAVRRWV